MISVRFETVYQIGVLNHGKSKNLRRLYQPRQRGLLHEVQKTQKRIQGLVCRRGACSGKAACGKQKVRGSRRYFAIPSASFLLHGYLYFTAMPVW